MKPDWCLVARNVSAAICARIEAGAERHMGEAGWLHHLSEPDSTRRYSCAIPIRKALRPIANKALAELADTCVSRISNTMLQNLSHDLGVTAASLIRLHTGWDGAAWTFPMRNASGTIIGIRRRFADGRKLSVRGGREGLIIPAELNIEHELFVTEGPTDCGALLDLGLPTIGRPSCTGGLAYLRTLARGLRVVIVADRDESGAGQRGAIRLAQALRSICPSVQIIIPPPGIKDARDWVRAGATRSTILKTLTNTSAKRRNQVPNADGARHRVSRSTK